MARRGRKKKEKPDTEMESTEESMGGEEAEEEGSVEDKNSESLDEDFEENDTDESESVPELEIGSKDHGARLLEIRRSIEERAEQRRFRDDLDYLDEEI